MSLFGGFMGEDDMFLGNPMQAMNMQMRSMNRLMNSLMPDPFNMLAPFDPGFQHNSLMERNVGGAAQMGLFGFPAMPNMNRLLNPEIAAPNGASYCSSSIVTMSSGPDGRPQIYQATTSTKTGPGGVRETRKTVQDSTRGIKKMAIGHHIGERAHIIEKEQDIGSGQLEERQEFINLDEEEAEDFDREFTTRAHHGGRSIGPGPGRARQMLSIEPVHDEDDDVIEEIAPNHRRQMPALTAPPSSYIQLPQQQHPQQHNSSNMTSTSATASSNTTPMNSNATIDLTANTNDDDCDVDVQTIQSNAMNTLNHNNDNNQNYNNNNHYLGGPTRRMYHHRGHHLSATTARRPLRTPPSSPLATTSTSHINSPAATLSVHPHPYNVSASRRRSKHTKLHQEYHGSANAANDGKKSPKHTKK